MDQSDEDELEAIKKDYIKKKNKAFEEEENDIMKKEGDFEEYVESLIKKTKVTWNDIAGLDNAKQTINESYLINIIENKPEAIESCNSILLFGPPGTGKTLLAAATSGTLKATFFNVKTGDLLSKYYGESSKIISALYNVARKKAPSIIFLDEFDSIGCIRNDKSEASHNVLSTLLTEMDGLHNKKSNQNVLTMAATNTPWDLDKAMLDRFEMKIYVPLADEQAVMEMIKLKIRKKGLELNGDMHKIAQDCVSKSFSGRNVAALCKEAINNMVRELNDWDKIRNLPHYNKVKYPLEVRPLTISDFRKSFAKIKGTITEREIKKYDDWARKNGIDFVYVKNENICEINEPEIYRKAQNEKVSERKEAAYEIGKNFKYFTDNKRATEVLQKLSKDEKWEVRMEAAKAISSAYIYLFDRGRAANDLLDFIKDENWNVQSIIAEAIGSAFKYFTDRDRATNDLLDLTNHQDYKVRSVVAEAIGSAFFFLTDQDSAIEALVILANDNDGFVRRNAAKAIGSSIFYLANKDRATEALLTLAKDKDIFVQTKAIKAIGSAFSHITDKVRAWNELLALIKHDDRFVLIGAGYALGSAFPHVTNKDQAAEDLFDLINDNDSDVRSVAAEIIGSVFPYINDKNKAIENLLALTKDKESIVRAYANHSLGRAYVLKATESKDEENFRKELEQALEFFEESLREEIETQPARFCLPFYRSFYMLTFKKEEAKDEVKKYLEEAKNAVKGSESKEKLLEAVKYLGNALREVQNLKKGDINAYRKYCEVAENILYEAETKAPGAVEVVLKGMPIIEAIIKEKQEKNQYLMPEINRYSWFALINGK